MVVEHVRLFVCFGLVAVLHHMALGQVALLCRPEERFLSCGGCQRSCREPAPQCDAVCRVGCYCPDDLVRGKDGRCIRLQDCPPLATLYAAETTEPRSNHSCPANEEYRFCEPCVRSCDNPNPVCPAQCARGCFCKGELLRDREGRCVELHQCHLGSSNKTRRFQTTTPPVVMTCDSNQVYKECETCERTCSNPMPACPGECRRGCFCTEGQVKGPDGKCVNLEDCPKAEVSQGAQELTVEDCGQDEEFFSCGWCEPTCSDPYPRCEHKICTRGCLCKPPLLRHHSGRCVQISKCVLHRCSDPNEEYTCGYGCEGRCDGRGCSARGRHCSLSCRCRIGLLRNRNETCVTPDLCETDGTSVNKV